MDNRFELNDNQLEDVSGGFLDGLFGYTEEPTTAALASGLAPGMVFNTRRSCMSCGETHYRVKDFHKDDKKFRVACCGCGSLAYWHYDILDTWLV